MEVLFLKILRYDLNSEQREVITLWCIFLRKLAKENKKRLLKIFMCPHYFFGSKNILKHIKLLIKTHKLQTRVDLLNYLLQKTFSNILL